MAVRAPAGAKGAYRLVLRVRDRTSGETAWKEALLPEALLVAAVAGTVMSVLYLLTLVA